jgi:putative FmdB family regulatory protein
MPIYEYRCKKCHYQFEILQRLKEKRLEKCPKCAGPLTRLISSPAIQFKGTGWYITDYAHKNSPSGGNGKNGHKNSKGEAPNSSERKEGSRSVGK